MIAKTKLQIVNSVYQASVAVELDAVDTKYVAAYGEPRVDVAGVIPYVSDLATPQTALAFDTAQDIGTVPVAGSNALLPAVGVRGYSISGSGTFLTNTAIVTNAGYFKGKLEVIGDFEIRVQLLSAPDVPDASIADGYGIGLGVFDSLATAGEPVTLLTWGAHRGAPRISHRRRTTAGGSLTEVAGVAQASVTGVYLRIQRVSGVMTAAYSLNAGSTWTSLGTSTSALESVSVGFFVNSGDSGAQVATVTDLLLQTLPDEVTEFTIKGSPNLRYIRSQSPHTFQLDSKVDPDAEAKVKGWISEITERLTDAKDVLFTNEDPSVADADGDEKVISL